MQNQYSELNNFGLLELYPPKPKQMDEEKTPEKVEKKQKKEKKKKRKIKLNRCNVCKKKLNITEQQMTCKCGSNFCSKHRLQSQHDCSSLKEFDKEAFKKKCGLGGGKFKQIEVL